MEGTQVIGHSRSSHQTCSMKKGALRNFTKFTGKHRLQSLFFNKVAGPRPKHLFYRTPLDDCFSHSEDPGALWTLRFRHLSLRYVDSQTLGHSGTRGTLCIRLKRNWKKFDDRKLYMITIKFTLLLTILLFCKYFH